MTTSNYITFILLVVIGLVFLIDFILNSRKKPLEKSVEKFVEEESGKKSWFNLKSFFWAYPIALIVSQIFRILEGFYPYKHDDYLEMLLEGPMRAFDGMGGELLVWAMFFLSVFHLLWFIISRYGDWIIKRKKNISMSLLIISFVKLLLNYFIYTTEITEITEGSFNRGWRYRTLDFSEHLSNLYSQEIDLFIPVTIVFLIVVWFFNDKIKAR